MNGYGYCVYISLKLSIEYKKPTCMDKLYINIV